MQTSKYIYSFIYDETESDLCKLESKYLFGQEEKNRLLQTDLKIDPSCSALIKTRLDIISSAADFADLIDEIKTKDLSIDRSKIEYLVVYGDTTEYSARLDKLKDIGYIIKGRPDYYNPITTFALCYFGETWYFGTLIKNNFDWHKHNKKPFSYSNSISINIAKALVNIATDGNKESKLLDACCGVGTIMLEACFIGIDIEGCEINWKICRNARENISHFDY